MLCEISFDGDTALGSTLDVSQSGAAYVLYHQDKPLPERVGVELRCGCGQTVSVRGKVVWQRPEPNKRRLVGIDFDDFDHDTHVDLLRLLFSCPHSWDNGERSQQLFRHSARYMVRAFGHVFRPPRPKRAAVPA